MSNSHFFPPSKFLICLLWLQRLFGSKVSLEVDVDHHGEVFHKYCCGSVPVLCDHPFQLGYEPWEEGLQMIHWNTLNWGVDWVYLVGTLLPFGAPREISHLPIYASDAFGRFDAGVFLRIIIIRDKILSLLKGSCPRWWCHLGISSCGWLVDMSSWYNSMMCVGSVGFSVVISTKLERFSSRFSI